MGPVNQTSEAAGLRAGGNSPALLVHQTARSANLINTAQVTPPRGARTVRHRSYVVHLADRALRNGGERVSLGVVHWNIAADCESPVFAEVEGRLDPAKVHKDHEALVYVADRWWFADLAPSTLPLLVTLELRCRKCPPCLRRRGAMWRWRCNAELAAAPRSWFGTLTLDPVYAMRAKFEAQSKAEKAGWRWGELSPEQRFRRIQAACSQELTRWLKRVRKESGAKLRYCLVAEAHKSGDPHWHVLIHETVPDQCVRERTLRKQWIAGFSKFNLVTDGRVAAYVAKYLTKSSLARVRASIDYGKEWSADIGNASRRVSAPWGTQMPLKSRF